MKGFLGVLTELLFEEESTIVLEFSRSRHVGYLGERRFLRFGRRPDAVVGRHHLQLVTHLRADSQFSDASRRGSLGAQLKGSDTKESKPLKQPRSPVLYSFDFLHDSLYDAFVVFCFLENRGRRLSAGFFWFFTDVHFKLFPFDNFSSVFVRILLKIIEH